MEVNIREYSAPDAAGVKKCISELKKYESQFDSDYLTNEKSTETLFADILKGKEEGGEIFIAEDNGKIAGFIALSVVNKNDELICRKARAVYISDFAVLPERRNKGIGMKLLEKANKFAKLKKINFIKLIVFAANEKARKLYERNGFENYEVTMIKETDSKS